MYCSTRFTRLFNILQSGGRDSRQTLPRLQKQCRVNGDYPTSRPLRPRLAASSSASWAQLRSVDAAGGTWLLLICYKPLRQPHAGSPSCFRFFTGSLWWAAYRGIHRDTADSAKQRGGKGLSFSSYIRATEQWSSWVCVSEVWRKASWAYWLL